MKQLIIQTKDIKPSNPKLKVLGIFNPGITRYKDDIIMIARVAEVASQTEDDNYLVPVITKKNDIDIIKIPKNNPEYDYSDSRLIRNHQKNYLTSISHFRIGRSKDGYNFTFDDEHLIYPFGIYEEYGIEDPRITLIDGRYYITYTGVSSYGINVRLMVTDDFLRFERLGNIFHPDNKDCVIFPQKINGKYQALHRPSLTQFGRLEIWLAESDNLLEWGNHSVVKEARIDFCDSVRVGAGSIPIATDKGWLEIYHTADSQSHYALVCALLDYKQPDRVLMRSKEALLKPTEIYEKKGFMKEVVFTCGHIVVNDDILIYYGVCDENIALCKMPMADLWRNMKEV